MGRLKSKWMSSSAFHRAPSIVYSVLYKKSSSHVRSLKDALGRITSSNTFTSAPYKRNLSVISFVLGEARPSYRSPVTSPRISFHLPTRRPQNFLNSYNRLDFQDRRFAYTVAMETKEIEFTRQSFELLERDPLRME